MNSESPNPLRDFLAPRLRFGGYLERASILGALRQLQGYVRPGAILDVGCGLKPYERLLCPSASRYWGLDYPVTMTGSYRTASRADVYADCRSLPFHAHTFDTVINTQVLEHVPEPAAFAAEMARVLRPGGRLILSAPMVWPLHEEPYDFYRYTLYGLRDLLGRAGLRILAEVPRGAAASALGQVFLDLHLGRSGHVSPHFRLYRALVSSTLNVVCLGLDRIWPNRRFVLGWAIAAEKQA